MVAPHWDFVPRLTWLMWECLAHSGEFDFAQVFDDANAPGEPFAHGGAADHVSDDGGDADWTGSSSGEVSGDQYDLSLIHI